MATARDNLARRQIYIPATQPETVQLRVAAYCRVSTDSEDQLNSFEAQYTHYSEMITNHDLWELVDIYADEGITGTSAKKRKDFQRMLADCRKGKIDKILVKSISRFARNTMECLETIRELKALGISVFFEEHNIDTKMVSSEMLTAVIASCAQAESESISKNMRWGVQKRMQQGIYNASAYPYGYRCVNNELVIHELEAAVVRRIFDTYLSGVTPHRIAEMLTADGNKDRNWRESTIKYILKNERYTGNTIFQKTFTTDTLPYKRKINRGEQNKYYVENANPAIISMEQFNSAQRLFEVKFKMRESRPGDSPLSGYVICGHCGAPYIVHHNSKNPYMSCRTHSTNRSLCYMKPIQIENLYVAFQRLYCILKTKLEILTELFAYLELAHSRQMLWSPAVMELNKEISDILSQSHSLSLLKKQGAVDSDVFISMSNQLAEQLRSAKQRKQKLQDQEEDQTIAQTECLIETLAAGPEFLDTFDEELFCELIDKIIVDSNTKIRFRLKNGLELPESIERTVR